MIPRDSNELRQTAGMLFSYSAFDSVIEAVRRDLSTPVTAPSFGAVEAALDLCASKATAGIVGLALTFTGLLAPLSTGLTAMAAAHTLKPAAQ